MLTKPKSSEYPEYYSRYINDLPDSGILDLYTKQTKEVLEFYKKLSKEKMFYRYEKDKWSIVEVLGHLLDSELIMGYRALTYARKDKSNVPMYDHDKYMETANFNDLDPYLIIEHFAIVRNSNLTLFNTITDEGWIEKGLTGNKEFTTRTIPYIIVGHTNHHIKVIKERYL